MYQKWAVSLRRFWVNARRRCSKCLSKLILFGETSLLRALAQYVMHYHGERNHQGKRNLLLFPANTNTCPSETPIVCKQRLVGLLRYYSRAG